MKEKIVQNKSKKFAVKIIELYKCLTTKNETVMSRQLLKSGTSIGANIAESDYAASKADFINKSQIAIKECSETKYWLDLLFETNYIDSDIYNNLSSECLSLLRLLTTIINNSKKDIT